MSKSFRLSLILAAVVVLLAVLVFNLLQQSDRTSSSARNQLYTDLLERSGIMNRDLPRLLDEQTRFERAEVVNYGMRFIYTLVRVDRFVHDEDAIEAEIYPQMLREYCQGEALAFYRERADFVEFRYLDQNELGLFTLRFEPNDC
ncbi:hypothetical protein IDAT_01480 [Pseudidiomarina atlantica]|jgi:hypothetical protein|uniref:Uncharacterized protein n=1 Tax=Pseudidiomarina atlantica TaxID=1517416 RepID=A0A094IVF9_9GAMM|nr:hypothetical protein [Pseudidiomarina atlantica]KFZ29794.1 hypothetical protein IDAT_01480 [Pseudidiomarina atlantica]